MPPTRAHVVVTVCCPSLRVPGTHAVCARTWVTLPTVTNTRTAPATRVTSQRKRRRTPNNANSRTLHTPLAPLPGAAHTHPFFSGSAVPPLDDDGASAEEDTLAEAPPDPEDGAAEDAVTDVLPRLVDVPPVVPLLTWADDEDGAVELETPPPMDTPEDDATENALDDSVNDEAVDVDRPAEVPPTDADADVLDDPAPIPASGVSTTAQRPFTQPKPGAHPRFEEMSQLEPRPPRQPMSPSGATPQVNGTTPPPVHSNSCTVFRQNTRDVPWQRETKLCSSHGVDGWQTPLMQPNPWETSHGRSSHAAP